MSVIVEEPVATIVPAAELETRIQRTPSLRLPSGPQWYLVVYRWILVVASLYTIAVTWNVWQNRSDPNWHPWSYATPANIANWENRPTDSQLAPMLPVWDGLPQFDFNWLIVASLLAILIFPRAGIVALSTTLVMAVLWDRTRLQPHYVLVFLMIGTLPGVNTQLLGRANLIALWFWAGFHKLIIDFIKPDGMAGFASDVIPNDLSRFFPITKYSWNTHNLGVAMGFAIASTEVLLGLLCFIPRARWIVAIAAIFVHASILVWNCLGPHCNLVGWNIALGLAGLTLILPWREWPWTSWLRCNWFTRIVAIVLLVSPALFYVNGLAAYLSYCIYVPNNPFAVLYRPGEEPKSGTFIGYEVINFPLSPAQSILEAYFNKIRQPGDVMVIHDPRPWAESHNMNGRQLTDFGEFPRGEHRRYYFDEDGHTQLAAEGSYVGDMKQGLWLSWHENGKLASQGVMVDDEKQGPWMQWHTNGNVESKGSYNHGHEDGLWSFWYADGQKEMEGKFVDGQMDGVWKTWTPSGDPSNIEFHAGAPALPEPAKAAN
jgi:hypothetical protein